MGLLLRFGCAVTVCLAAAPRSSGGPEAQTSRPTYRCPKVKEKITIDGRLDEPCWSVAPVMPLRGIVDGSKPALATAPRLVWDDQYLYVGVDIRDPDVWSRIGLRDEECSKAFVEKVNVHRRSKNPEWHRLECDIMTCDKFIKAIVDPDGDGKNYVEIHVNPINNRFDCYHGQGFRAKWGDREMYPHVTWQMEGLLTATQVQGTLNAPHDKDKGWTLEVALPWKSFKPLTRGACPPKTGDVWTAHVGRIHKPKFRVRNTYWTWPVIGQVNCHLPHTYGRLVFVDETAK